MAIINYACIENLDSMDVFDKQELLDAAKNSISFKSFKNGLGWCDWMDDYTTAGDGEEPSEVEIDVINEFLQIVYDYMHTGAIFEFFGDGIGDWERYDTTEQAVKAASLAWDRLTKSEQKKQEFFYVSDMAENKILLDYCHECEYLEIVDVEYWKSGEGWISSETIASERRICKFDKFDFYLCFDELRDGFSGFDSVRISCAHYTIDSDPAIDSPIWSSNEEFDI